MQHHDIEAKFDALVAGLEDELRAQRIDAAQQRVRRCATVFGVGAVATVGAGLVHPVIGVLAFLGTVLTTSRAAG